MLVARLMCLALCAASALANFVIDIAPGTVECFMEDATAGTGILASFVVEAGGNLDVDVSITSPDGALIAHSTPGASDETVRAKAPVDGKYTICFSNEMSGRTWKTVQFSILVGEAPTPAASQTEEKQRMLVQMINELAHSLTAIKHDQEFMDSRMHLHQMVASNTNTKVVHWFTFQAVLMIAMCAFQIYYIKQTFEVKMVV